MERFEELLQRFDSTLQKYNPKNYKKLQPPLPKQVTEGLFNKLHIDDPGMKAMYEWKNGVNISEGLGNGDMIFDFGVLFPLESVLKYAEDYPQQNPQLINFVGDSTGDGLLFNIERGPDYGKIYVYSVSLLSIDDPYGYYDSIYSMIETTIRSYQTGALKYDDINGFLDKEDDNFVELATKLNPQSNWWKFESY
jgi:hypothetical protein